MKLSKWIASNTANDAILHRVYSGGMAVAIWEANQGFGSVIQRYEVYLNKRERRQSILDVRVTDRSVDLDTIRTLCEYLLFCFENNLSADVINPYGDSTYQPYFLPEPTEGTLLAGVRLGRIYVHRDGGLYKVNAVTNVGCIDQDKWPETVVYRDAITGKMFSRPVAEFLDEERYRLHPHGVIFPFNQYIEKRKAYLAEEMNNV